MPHSIERMEGERQSEDGFSGVFHSIGESSNELYDVSAREGFGSDEVGEGETVEQHTERYSSNTVSDGSEPGQLGLIDGEMRTAGALEALFVQNID